MSFDFFGAINSSANKLLTLAAGAEQSIHTFEASNPFVGQAISLAESEMGAFPPVTEALAIFKAVLGLAQAVASVTAATGAVAAPASMTKANNS